MTNVIARSFLDRFIGFFSPAMEFRRIQNKLAINSVTRKYEGASKGRRTKNWIVTSQDAQSTLSAHLDLLRDRSRDLIRNNPYAKKGIQVIASNVVGTGIMIGLEEAEQKRWDSWAETTNCDLEGKLNFYMMQSLIMKTVAASGECLVRKYRSKGETRIKLQVLEPDFLDKTQDTKNKNIKDGIEFDEKGKVVAYHLYEVHPGARTVFVGKNTFKSNRIPADEILHIFRQERSGQVRGEPWLTPVIIKMKDFDDYEDAQLVRQKIAACFVGFMTDTEDPTVQTSTTEEKKPMSERFEPGSWEVLPPGKDIKFGNPPGVGNDYDPYCRRSLSAIASGLGITYESLTGDLSNVNFSTGRMGWIEMGRNIEEWRWLMLIPQFCEPVYKAWAEAENLDKTGNVPYKKPTWTPPRREMIDPSKEIVAMKDSIRSGLSTLSDSLRQLGINPKQHFAEYAADMKKLDELKLTLDSDARTDLQLKKAEQATANPPPGE